MSDSRTYASPMPASAEALDRWHRSPGALNRLQPPWMHVNVIERHGSTDPGDWVRLNVSVAGPIGFDWTLVHESLPSPNTLGFADVQRTGPFANWRHEHRFLPTGANTSSLEDALRYQMKAGTIGEQVAGTPVSGMLDRLFALRHLRTWNDLVRHHHAGFTRPLRIVVTGSSGLVGERLIPFLQGGGHRVQRLVRHSPAGSDEIGWDPSRNQIDAEALEGVDAVIHLAGVSISGGRWTTRRKQAILDSRLNSTRLLATTLASLKRPPSVFVSTSAVGMYGDAGDRELTEDAPAGTGFLADVCRQWEAAADPARAAGIRVVHPRFGVVFAGEGGMLPLIAKPFRAGVGGPLGSGNQFMSWVALDDLVGMLLACIADDRLVGAVNAVSPTQTTNAEFTRAMGRVLRRPTIFRVPAGAMKLVGGELVDELVLASQRVVPARLLETGFPFAFADLNATLAVELGASGVDMTEPRLPAPILDDEEVCV